MVRIIMELVGNRSFILTTGDSKQSRLKLSHTKTVTAAFHLNNREAIRELKVYNNDRFLPFCQTPTYLGVKLDRSFTFRHHLVALRKNYPRASHG